MEFTVSNDLLEQLCTANSFNLPEAELVLFGFRGCLPVQPDNSDFGTIQKLRLADLDYSHPRCTIGQWKRSVKEIAVFPASTVPHIKYIRSSVARKGEGTNQIMTGFYKDYRKGTHKPGTPTGHEAFRQTASHPIRRTADDYDFDNDDRVEFSNPCDNIHAGWCMGINHADYASAGCQVIVGYPACQKRGNEPDAGPWKIFKANAYETTQQGFPYLLLNGTDAFAAAQSGGGG